MAVRSVEFDAAAPKNEPRRVFEGPDSARPQYDFNDEEESRHRGEAVGVHIARAAKQLRDMGLAIFIVIAAPAVWRAAYSAAGATFDTPWTPPFLNIDVGLMSNVTVAAVWVFGVATTAIAGLTVVYLYWYRFERDRDWREAAAKADAREPEVSADGYMQIFRLYAKTKRRAIFTMLFGMVGIYWGAIGVFAAVEGKAFNVTTIMLAGAATAQIAAALLIVYRGFDIGRRFVPGKVLIRKTLILSFLATTSQTDYSAAQEKACELERAAVERKPWWFYSYRKKPANFHANIR